jgi:hypothetical protein
VILANSYQVDDAPRLAPIRSEETPDMPAWPWIVRCGGFAPSPREWAHNLYDWTDTISPMFNFGKPRTAGDWLVHVAGAIVALFLVWWLLRLYVL